MVPVVPYQLFIKDKDMFIQQSQYQCMRQEHFTN